MQPNLERVSQAMSDNPSVTQIDGHLSLGQRLRYSIAVLMCIGGCLVPQAAQAQYVQRSFLNPSFEQNLVPYSAKPTSPGFTSISTASACYAQVGYTPNIVGGIDQGSGSVPFWKTTHGSVKTGTGNCASYVTPGNVPLIELWTKGFSSSSGGAVTPVDGTVFAELNAEAISELFQNLCLIQGETVNLSVDHRGRSSATVPDVAAIEVNNQSYATISTTNTGTSSSALASPSPTNGTMSAAPTRTALSGGWVQYNGSFVYTAASGVVPIGFNAISTGNGNLTTGNFIDFAQFAGKPIVEIAAATSGQTPESVVNPTNPPQIRVVGLVTSPISVTVTATGGSPKAAVIGQDYLLNGGTNTTYTLTVPVGNYDGTTATNSLFTVPITIIPNNTPDGDRSVDFAIQPSSSFFNLSTTTCGGSPITASNYIIYDDFILGTVWDDANGSGSKITGTNASKSLNAILVNSSTGKVIDSVAVASNGQFTFQNVAYSNSVYILISTTAGTVGASPPAASIPSGWVTTQGSLTSATFTTTNGIGNKDFWIEQLPTANK